MGFQIQGQYSTLTPILDLQEGFFVAEIPLHPYYVISEHAQAISTILSITFYNDLENIKLNRTTRRILLQHLQQYIALHIADFGEMRSLTVLQEVLNG